MRPIGFVRRKGSHVFPYDNGETWLVNDKGETGKTLEEIGVPADAKLHVVQRKVVVETSYEAV